MAASSNPLSRKPEVVVVDDDDIQLNMLCGLLQNAGLNPVPCESAEIALAAMNPAAPPAVIITDLNMPGIDGWRFCRLLRSPEYPAFNFTPVLVVSATFSGDEPSRITSELGANAFLSMPVDGQQLIETVQSLLQGETPRQILKVIIVEDSKLIAKRLVKAFQFYGYQTAEASSYQEGLAMIGQTAYDVAVLDYHLPDGRGDALLQEIRLKYPDCACLMITADPQPGLALTWLKMGAAAYLKKPFAPDYLVTLCERARRERALLRVQDLLEMRTRQMQESAAHFIAERQQVEQALRQTEEKYSLAFHSSPDSININRLKDGLYIEINEGFTSLTGYTPTDVAGKTSLEIDIWVNPQDRALLVKGLRECGLVNNLEAPFRIKNGQIKICQMSARVIKMNGEMCILSITRDITGRRQAEEKFRAAQVELEISHRALLGVIEDQKESEEKIRQLNAELEQRVQERTEQLNAVNQELEAFSYSVSHDLRAPLRALDGYSEALLSDYQEKLDRQGQHYLVRIQEASRRMGQLIEDLLNLSRITRCEIGFTSVNLSLLARKISDELLAQTPERRVEFEISPALVVQADANLMKIALENLLSNALKFTGKQERAHIHFGVLEQPGSEGQVFFVRDNGAGFDMNYAGKLFKPFQRLHRNNEYAGTGIGLTIVQRIITRHGGRIWPEAAVNQGATFYFTLGA